MLNINIKAEGVLNFKKSSAASLLFQTYPNRPKQDAKYLVRLSLWK
jgi:hypothetical protein